MDKAIKLTNENIDDIKYEDVIAVTIAEGGAMGEPNSFYVVLHNMKLYYLNFEFTDIDMTKLNIKFPLLSTFKCFSEHVFGIDSGWKWFNMGFGNYLLVRERYYEKIDDYINKNLSEEYEHGELYQKWFEILKIVE